MQLKRQVFLKRLWKGTLHMLVVSTYIGLAIGMFLIDRWYPLFVTVFLILLAQSLRYIASAMDRIAFHSSNKESGPTEAQTSSTASIVSSIILWLLVQACNAFIILTAMNLGSVLSAIKVGIALVCVEVAYLVIRAINRTISYESASFGIADRSIFRDGPIPAHSSINRERERINRRLQTLHEMVEKGEISQRAYSKARDKYLVKQVMEAPEDESPV